MPGVPFRYSGSTKWTDADHGHLEDSIREHQDVMKWYGEREYSS